MVELNVEEQCVNLIKIPMWQKHYITNHYPSIHGWVFDIETGNLIDLEFDFTNKWNKIKDVYDLGKED